MVSILVVRIGEPASGARLGGHIAGRDIRGEGQADDTARVVVGGQGQTAIGDHLVTLIGHGQLVGVLDVGQAVEQEVERVVLDGRVLEVQFADSVKILAVVVLVPQEAGLLARDDATGALEALRTERDGLGVFVRVGGHHLQAVAGDELLVVEGKGRDGIPGETVEVQVLDVAEADHIFDVGGEALGRKDSGFLHQGVKTVAILIHSAFLLD